MLRRTKFVLMIVGVMTTLGCTMQAEQENIPQSDSTIVTRSIQKDEVEEVIPDTNQMMEDRYNIIEEDIEEWIEVNLHISYYTSLLCENTSYGAVDAIGGKLVKGTVAAPKSIPFHTVFEIDNFDGEYAVRDRGSSKYIKWIDDNTLKIDMFIPRNKGENDSAYYRRVNNMGITKTTGRYKLPDKE